MLPELAAEYEIISELGRGGTAIVYHARERELGRDVAIKVVRAYQPDDTEAVTRLAREAKLVAVLRHPNIVPLLGIRHLENGLALIMQHVPGKTLKRTIREHGALPLTLVEHVVREVASALDYAWTRHRIVHRDIKPENIYLDDDCRRALVADFGIAKATETESTLTLVGTALGTPAYMSPEQIDGSPLDARSDLYSLGLVTYEMLTGQQPWAGCNLYTTIYKQKHESLPAISDFRSDVPVYLQRAVDTLLRKDPAERCTDAASFLALLPSNIPTPPLLEEVDEEISHDIDDNDTPTLKYQRPMVEAAPVVSVVLPEAPPEPDLDAVLALLEPVQPGRGGLAIAAASATEVVADPVRAAVIEETLAETFTITAEQRKAQRYRLVAALAGLLVLGASATAAMMTRGGRPAKQDIRPTVTSDSNTRVTAPTTSLKSSGEHRTPASLSYESLRPQTKDEEPQPEEKVKPLPTPSVNVPEAALPAVNRSISAGDFATDLRTSRDVATESASPTDFTPYTVKPELRNRDAVARALAVNYPVLLRERGIGGTVILRVFIDDSGKVVQSHVQQSSGEEVFDRAAIKVASVMKFTPALNRDQRVSVWLDMPVVFKTQ